MAEDREEKQHEDKDESSKEEKKDQEPEKALSEDVVQPERVRVWEDGFKKLCVSVDGEERHGVFARRVFPLTDKADYISFVNSKGKEMAIMANPGGLDKCSRRTLLKALERMYYVARIIRVDSITEKMGVGHWKVMTDRGYAAFEVVDRSNIRKLGNGRVVLADADGNRFEIENTADLDQRSQALIYSEI